MNVTKALGYLELANQKAARVYALEEAKVYFDEAMKLLDILPETEENQQRRISLLVSVNQWQMFLLLLKFPEYYDLLKRYEPVADELGNPDLLGILYARLAQCNWWFGNFDEAIQIGTKAVELCEAAGNIEGTDNAFIAMQWSYLYKSDYDKVLAMKEDILHMAEQQFNLRRYVYGFSGASIAYSELGRWEEAVKEGQEALKAAEEFSDKSNMSYADMAIGLPYLLKGDLDRAIEYWETALRQAQTPSDQAYPQLFLALAWCRAGEPHRGIEILATMLQMNRAVGFRPGEVFNMLYLGEGYWLAGEYDKARQTLEEGVQLAESRGMKYYFGYGHRLMGEIALKTNIEQAKTHFEQSITILREINAENELALAYAGYGRFYKLQGNMDQAKEYLTKTLEILERLGTLIEPDKVREELAGLPAG